MNTETPTPHTYPTGGTDLNNVRCTRCDQPASYGYEGVEGLDFCEDCYRAFQRFIKDIDQGET